MDKSTIQKLKARIQRANRSLNCFGDILLMCEIDGLELHEMLVLQAGLKAGRVPVTYAYLDQAIEAELRVGA